MTYCDLQACAFQRKQYGTCSLDDALRNCPLAQLRDFVVGDLIPLETFIECVRVGGYTDDDGRGELRNTSTGTHEDVICDIDWLESRIGKYKYVLWYNR